MFCYFQRATLVSLVFLSLVTVSGVSGVSTEEQRRTQTSRGSDYANFSHATHVSQEKLACNSCHKVPTANWKMVRKGDDAFPDVVEFPEHATCLGCHRQQFFARERPVPKICTNCHVKGTPIDTSRYSFPSLGEPFLTSAKGTNFVSEFRVFFPHDKHADADCGDCHQTYQPQGKADEEFVTKPPKDIGDGFWLKKGTFKTRPLTHASCFTCHNQESELAPLPSNCDTCHKSFVPEVAAGDFYRAVAAKMGLTDWWTLTAWRSRTSAGTFRHETHPDLKCAQCHDPAALDTTKSATQKVPVKSCGGAEGCHVTATSDDGGILNYEIDQRRKDAKFTCTKCHNAFGEKAVPAGHLEVIPAQPAAASERPVFAHASFQTTTDFSQFKHDNRNHSRLPCLLCHRRENNSPQPTLPGKAAHAPCTGCHQPQFSDSRSEICTICHTDVQNGKVKAFPALRNFDARFDHAKHAALGAACSTCHRRNRNGVGLSIPARQSAHVTCFSCHTPGAQRNGRDISSCSTCHQPGRLVRTSEQAPAFRVGFSHAHHDESEKLTCGACHQVRAGLPRGRQVTAPLPLNHHAPAGPTSCATCHNGKRVFGGDDFSTCARCHKGSLWRF